MEAAPAPVLLMEANAEQAVDLGAPAPPPAVDLGEKTPLDGGARPPIAFLSKPLEDVMAAAAAPAVPAPTKLREELVLELARLREEAVAISAVATSEAEVVAQSEIDAVVCRLRAEQDRLFSLIMDHVPLAVRAAAHMGTRSAVVFNFSGQDKLDEFCYLYMLKGPTTSEGKATLRRLGIVPVLARLRETLNPAGFRVWHTWQRATNDNSIAVSW